ncbi:MAG: tyrosine-type recombinase/integrase [Candidatus Dormibacteria bacterium]
MSKGRRRGSGEGSVFQRGDGLWVAALGAAWDRKGRSRKVAYARTQAEAIHRLDRLKAEAGAGLPPVDNRVTVGKYLEGWLAAVEQKVRPRTRQHYAYVVGLLRGPVANIGGVKLAKLQPVQVEEMLARLGASGLSPRTCWHARSVLRTAFGDGMRLGIVGRNPAQLADPPRVAHEPPRVLTPEQTLSLLNAISEPGLRRLATVAVHTGLRQGELLGLRWADLDAPAGELHVTRALQRLDGAYQLVEVKSRNSRRTVPLTSAAVEALDAERRAQLEARLAAGARWREPIPGLVFTTTTGQPRSASAITHAFADQLAAAGLAPMHWHHLRHAFAGLMLASGSDLGTVSSLLGHTSVALTASTYAGVMPSLKRSAAEQLGRLLQQPG